MRGAHPTPLLIPLDDAPTMKLAEALEQAELIANSELLEADNALVGLAIRSNAVLLGSGVHGHSRRRRADGGNASTTAGTRAGAARGPRRRKRWRPRAQKRRVRRQRRPRRRHRHVGRRWRRRRAAVAAVAEARVSVRRRERRRRWERTRGRAALPGEVRGAQQVGAAVGRARWQRGAAAPAGLEGGGAGRRWGCVGRRAGGEGRARAAPAVHAWVRAAGACAGRGDRWAAGVVQRVEVGPVWVQCCFDFGGW